MLNKIAAIQMNSCENVQRNLETAKQQVILAKLAGAEMAILPEMFATWGMDKTQLARTSESFQPAGLLQHFLQDLARTNKIWIIGGTIPLKSATENKYYAACLIYNDLGECVARYDKTHLFDAKIPGKDSYQGSESFVQGDAVVAFDTPLGKVGVAVCYDIRFPEFTRQLFNKKVDIIAVPAAFTKTTGAAHWESLTRCRAIENQCYVIAACQTGIHANKKETYGHSCIIDPWGTITHCLVDQEGFIASAIDHTLIQTIRHNMPIHLHSRITLPHC